MEGKLTTSHQGLNYLCLIADPPSHVLPIVLSILLIILLFIAAPLIALAIWWCYKKKFSVEPVSVTYAAKTSTDPEAVKVAVDKQVSDKTGQETANGEDKVTSQT